MSGLRLQGLDTATPALSGDATFEQIPHFWKKNEQILAKRHPKTLDLSQLQQMDSSLLALLLEIRRMGKQADTCISFSNVPKTLQALAKLTNTHTILFG